MVNIKDFNSLLIIQISGEIHFYCKTFRTFWIKHLGNGFGELYEISSNFSADNYLELLREKIIPTLRNKYPEPHRIYFFQDQCPVHKNHRVISYLQSLENFEVINLPPRGSDMNPIEHVWGMMVRRIKINPVWTLDEFRIAVQNAWDWAKNKDDYFVCLSQSMTDRFMTVIGHDGWYTKY